jgi:hypothetical protein
LASVMSKYSGIKLGDSFKKEEIDYIERCRLEDGGYFFARIPPSSGMDTYFAIQSLEILGIKPERPGAIIDFVIKNVEAGMFTDITSIFLGVEVLNKLGNLTETLKNYARSRLMALQNKVGGFGACENINIKVVSELQDTYRAVRVLNTIGADFDREEMMRFVSGFLNLDGGYGLNGFSTLASTFYALEIQKLLELETGKLAVTRDYLRKREKNWQVQFIEDLYWLVLGLVNLGEKTRIRDRLIRFVKMCQRPNGGFSRATEMGIPTLEYTFYALSILKEIKALV